MDTLFALLITVAVVAFVIWLFILLPMQLAETRGRSRLGWVLISLFFSPLIAIIALMVLGDSQDKLRSELRR